MDPDGGCRPNNEWRPVETATPHTLIERVELDLALARVTAGDRRGEAGRDGGNRTAEQKRSFGRFAGVKVSAAWHE
jgi:hypothetical protein